MSTKVEMLDVVDEEGNILYQATRGEIHTAGLLHREVHVWLYTPEGEIIFQHRSKTKDTFPDLLDASVGGHVDLGESYECAVLRECNEEIGVDVKSVNELTFISTTITYSKDEVTKKVNHSRRNTYAYCYRGKIEDIKIEPGESQGFSSYRISSLLNLNNEEKKKFIPGLVSEDYLLIYKRIAALI